MEPIRTHLSATIKNYTMKISRPKPRASYYLALLAALPASLQADPLEGLKKNHNSDIDPNDNSLIPSIRAAKTIGEVAAVLAEASVADEAGELLDGKSGDTDFPYLARLKAIATVGEYDPVTGHTLTGYPDGNAAWLADNTTVRFAYQSESYATMSSETYPWEMANGASFTGSHIHTIDYSRTAFADFLKNDKSASTMFQRSGKLFDTVYNAFGDEVVSRAAGGRWGNQTLPDGSEVDFHPGQKLSDADFFFQSFCGAHLEKAHCYALPKMIGGPGCGFEDDVWLCAEEWKITNMYREDSSSPVTIDPNETMGLASLAVDVKNGVAYTVPALGQTGYEKLLPINPGCTGYVAIVCAGYNHNEEPAPLKIYIGRKGYGPDGNIVNILDPSLPARDRFLARNGLLYGKIYGLAIADADYAALGIETPDASTKMMDQYLKDADAAETFEARFYPTSYQWTGWGSGNAKAVKDTEMFLWGSETPAPGYTYFNGDTKTEHPAADPDTTKFRYIQNLTQEGGMLAFDFTQMVSEMTATPGLPEFLSVSVRRIIPALDGSLSLEVGDKGIKPNGATHATDRSGRAKTTSPDGLQWIKTADADLLIVDEDSGNSQGERKFALVLDSDTLELAIDKTGYFLASAGGSANPRANSGSAAYPGTFSRATSAEFSGSWNVTALIEKKEDGSFYQLDELAGPKEQQLNQSVKLAESTIVGVVQMKGESAGSVAAFRDDQGGQAFSYQITIPYPGLAETHLSDVDPENDSFSADVKAAKRIGEVTALMAEASVANQPSEFVDGESGDTNFAYLSAMKVIATVGEYDPVSGYTLTGYPDGNAAWLADNETLRFAYQSESYATMSSETYPWFMESGASFTGSHIHTLDYDREGFASFLTNSDPAAKMLKSSGKLFDTVYNVFGNLVVSREDGGRWGNQSLPDGSEVDFAPNQKLSDADFFFQSFCGAHLEKAHRYALPKEDGGNGIGFEDDVWLCAEEWKISSMYRIDSETPLVIDPNETMGLASLAIDVKNGIAYTVPALGQTGYEKLLPVNPGKSDFVVIVCAGYNHEQEPAPLKIYLGRKGMDANGQAVDQSDPETSERDKFLARNGLLHGKLYGMAVANGDYPALGIDTPNPSEKMMDGYLTDPDAANLFSVRFYPTSYQWAGWGKFKAVATKDTEMFKWETEQPSGYTYFNGDTKTEHPAVDPDITKFRYIQNLTQEGGILAVEFVNLISELSLESGLPDFISAEARRIVPAIDGALSLQVGSKGVKPNGDTHSSDRNGADKTTSPDGLQWIKTSDADVLIVDEDSGNSQGERKFALVLNPETLELAEANTGYFLASAGGSANPRTEASAAAYPGTFSRATSAEFSGSWNVTALIARQSNGKFYTPEQLIGPSEQAVNQSVKLADSTLVGVVQMKGESGGSVAAFRDDQGGQAFAYKIDVPTMGGTIVFELGPNGNQSDETDLTQRVRAGMLPQPPAVTPAPGYLFLGWDQDPNVVTGDMNLRALLVKETDLASCGFMTMEQIESMTVNPVIKKGTHGNFILELDVITSTDMKKWRDFNVNPESLSKNAKGNIELEFVPTGNQEFFRFVLPTTEE
jgi:hypothetical protein